MTNAAKQHSINHGTEMKVGKTTYYGRNPMYVKLENFGFIKAQKGIPFVNMDKIKS